MSEFTFCTDQAGATLHFMALGNNGVKLDLSSGYSAVADIELLHAPGEILLSLTAGSITLSAGVEATASVEAEGNVAVVFTVANWTTLTAAMLSELVLTLPDGGERFRCRVVVTKTSDSSETVYEPTFRLKPAPT